jgi:hypothetical protein
VRAGSGVEGSEEIRYELGLFKTDGSSLVNASGEAIVIEGVYGEGTADALDFDTGVAPRVTIREGERAGTFGVKTLEDARYELPKTVVVNFEKIRAPGGTRVAFESPTLGCTGTVIDQPAIVKIESLGDHRVDNNVVSGFFNISLHRASDEALIVNATGADIITTVAVEEADSLARVGRDFVLTNQHDLRLDGNGSRSTVTLSGVVLYNEEQEEQHVRVTVENVQAPPGALPVEIPPGGARAAFTIKR